MNDLFQAMGIGITTLFQPDTMLYLISAVIISLIFGIIPGISAMTSMPLALPFIFRMTPEVALPFLVGLCSAGMTGGAISAILLNVPGTPGNAATVIDGYPMTQKGEGNRAIGAAVTASMTGGVFSVILSIAMIPIVLPIIMLFNMPELLFTIILGLAFMAVMTGKSKIKGLVSGGVGLLISFIGFQAVTGQERFAFGTVFLYDGLDITAICLGLFGVAELMEMHIKGQTSIVQTKLKGTLSQTIQGAKDVWHHKWLWFRSTIIGYIVGVIPGIGATTSCFVAYGQAKQLSKNPEKFGTGCVEGVIAPQSSDNANNGGSLLTTMALGIPGDAMMAILLGGFLLVGVIPGPTMLTERLPLAYTLLLAIVFANIIGGVICFFSARYMVKLTSISLDFLFPLLIVIILVGAFVTVNNIANIIVVIITGLIGFIGHRFGYPRPTLLLGFIMGPLFEKYFFHSLLLHGPWFFLTPICGIITALIIGTFSYPYLRKAFTKQPARV